MCNVSEKFQQYLTQSLKYSANAFKWWFLGGRSERLSTLKFGTVFPISSNRCVFCFVLFCLFVFCNGVKHFRGLHLKQNLTHNLEVHNYSYLHLSFLQL